MDYDTNKNIGQKHENKTNSLACTQSSENFSGVFLNYYQGSFFFYMASKLKFALNWWNFSPIH